MKTLRSLLRARLVRGMLGGSRFWLVVGLLAGARKLARRLGAETPQVVYCEQLEPGQALLISHVARTGRNTGPAEPR